MWFPSASTWLIAWVSTGVFIAVLQMGVLRRLRISPLIEAAPSWMISMRMVASVFALYGIMNVCLTGYEVARLSEGQGASWAFLFVAAALGYRGGIAFRRKTVAHWLVARPDVTKAEPQLVINRLIVPYVQQYAQVCWRKGASQSSPLPSPLTVHILHPLYPARRKKKQIERVSLLLPNGRRAEIRLKGERAAEKLLLMLAVSFGFPTHSFKPRGGSIVWEMAGDSGKGQLPGFRFT